jgi:hypothetical protein
MRPACLLFCGLAASSCRIDYVSSPNLTRMRAGDGHVPTPQNAEYYRQRRLPGSHKANCDPCWRSGNPGAPGIYIVDQIAGDGT